MPLFACQNEIPVITSCPPAGSKVLLFDVTGATQYKGMALLDLDVFKCCLLYQMFGVGIKTITGADLVAGIYQNTGLVGDFLVFANFIARFLFRGTEWDYVRNDVGVVVGFEVFDLVNYDDTDQFIILPNPTCTGTPASAFPEGINTRFPETGYLEGLDDYNLDWTTALMTKYGPYGNFTVWLDDGGGDGFQPTGILPIPNDVDNPTSFAFSGLGGFKFFIVIG